MRLKEAVVSVPLHPGGLNNNQLHRSEPSQPGTEELENRNENNTSTTTVVVPVARSPTSSDFSGEDTEDFRVAEDTTTWSSLAITRDNAPIDSTNNDAGNLNNNLSVPRIRRNSSVESLADYEGRNSSHEDSSHELTPSEWSDWSEEGNLPAGCRGIVNPNYPGFQHLAPSLLSDTDLTEDEHESCPDYTRFNEIDARPVENDNEYNNNIEDSINHLCGQKNQRKIFYEKPKFNIQVNVRFVLSDFFFGKRRHRKLCNHQSFFLRTEEKILSPESEIVNGVVEAETHLTVLEPEEGLADTVVAASTPELTEAVLEVKQEREIPVEVEIVELTTSVKETPQFPEIEEIPDSGKTSEVGETDDIVVEHIDLIREAKELPHQARSKIGNRQTVTSTGSADDDSESNTDTDSYPEEQPTYTKLEEIDLLSSIGRDIGVDLEKYVQPVPDVVAMEALDPIHMAARASSAMNMMKDGIEDTNKLLDRDLPEASSADTRKKEKMARNQAKRRQQQQQQQQQLRASNAQRRPDKRRADVDIGPGVFDVYNIETAMPKIDLDAIESHLRAAREEERRDDDKEPAKEEPKSEETTIASCQKSVETKEPEREDLVTRFDRVVRGDPDEASQRRNDREEIRRRLAMGPDAEDLRAERGRKPSLQSRLQSGMNLQICFMNETASDTESPCSENDASPGSTPASLNTPKQQQKQQMPARPQVLSLPPLRLDVGPNSAPIDEADFFARQARLQTEARMALAQAKEMAHMQMEVERQRLKQSPITEMVRSSLEKVGVQLGEDRRRLSRVLLTELNVAQLQVVANDLHARIAALNEALVEGLLRRDDLHMEQDSMLVDIEDLTRYLGTKQEALKKKQNAREQQTSGRNHQQTASPAQSKTLMKPKLTHRGLVSLVRK
ncbi:Schwannomin-interacting protein 1 [Dufourea novaeangliae]|uniref:Schwannomin-interacting protein 1 n=1 Tax=Dufourea novaeangliae TaxID=178035 RepID=A0A154NZ48_DUFNO|nr:Schwannomin-interacting protein 1 [Dufourea novaeangliae]